MTEKEVKLDAWDIERINYYNKRIEVYKLEADTAEGERKDGLLASIKLFEDVVHRMENGSPPPAPIEQKQYYIEPEDDSCAGGACKI